MRHTDITSRITQAAPTPAMSSEQLLHGTMISGESDALADQQVAFRLLEVVGQGGMGIVYRAQQDYPRRIVALKVLKATIATPSHVKRFEREIAILARLQHPGISQLYSVGLAATQIGTSVPFLAMEYIHGEPITDYARTHLLSLEEKLALMVKVCDAVGHAHDLGVIHRDLKPSNILVNPSGTPKILDFGLARMGGDTPMMSSLTEAGQLLGTLDYMSPEQASETAEAVDQRADVYALGVILFELLSGHRPLDLSGCSIIEAIRRLQDTQIERLSGRSRVFRGDLDTITGKALARDRSQRYATARDLADDLRHFLAYEPILARQPTLVYRATRFVRRNRYFVTAVSLIIGALSIGLIAAAREAHRANLEAARATLHARQTQLRLAESQVARGDTMMLTTQFAEARDLYNQAWDTWKSLGESTLPAELGIWAADIRSPRPIRVVEKTAEDVQRVTISKDQHWLAIGYQDGRVRVEDLFSGAEHLRLQLPSNIQQLVFSPDGQTLAMGSTGCLEVWDIARKVKIRAEQTPDESGWVLANNDSVYTLFAGVWCRYGIHHTSDISESAVERTAIRRCIAAGLVGQTALVLNDQGEVFQLESNHVLRSLGKLAGPPLRSAEFSPDCTKLEFISDHVHIVSLPTLTEIAPALHHDGEVTHAGFINETMLWIENTKEPTIDFTRLDQSIVSTVARPTGSLPVYFGNMSVLANKDKELTLWASAAEAATRVLATAEDKPSGVGLSDDGRIAAIGISGGEVRLVDTVGGQVVGSLFIGATPRYFQFSKDGTHLAIVTDTDRIQVWDLVRVAKIFEHPLSGSVTAFALAASGQALCVSVRRTHGIVRYDLSNQSEVGNVEISLSGLCAAISPNIESCVVLTTTGCEVLNIREPRTPILTLKDSSKITRAAFVSNGTQILTSNVNDEMRLWRASDGGLVSSFHILPGHTWSARGSRLISQDGESLNIKDLTAPQQSRSIHISSGTILGTSLSGDGIRCLYYSKDLAAIVDWSEPSQFRNQEQANGSTAAKHWLGFASTLSAPALERFASEKQFGTPLENGYGFWMAGDNVKAHEIFADCVDIAPGTKALLMRATAPAAP